MVGPLSPCQATSPATRQVHTYHAVALCTDGQAIYEAGAAYRVGAGDLYIVPAGTPHALTRVDGLKLWGVAFCPACFAAQSAAASLSSPDPVALLAPFDRVRAGAAPVAHADPDRRARALWLLTTLRAEQDHTPPAPHTDALQAGALVMLLAEVARAFSPPPTQAASSPPLVADALAWIERRCLDPISLHDVAAALRRSPSYLTAQVRAATGKTVQAWIIAGRVSEACRRLLQTDERVDVIAERVGYADPTHFIRLFRRHLAMTPAAWRRLHRTHP